MAIRGNLECNALRNDFRSVGGTIFFFFFKLSEPPSFPQLLRKLAIIRGEERGEAQALSAGHFMIMAKTERARREDEVQLLHVYSCRSNHATERRNSAMNSVSCVCFKQITRIYNLCRSIFNTRVGVDIYEIAFQSKIYPFESTYFQFTPLIHIFQIDLTVVGSA